MASVRLRAAIHRAIDIVLDALEEEQAEAGAVRKPRKKRSRTAPASFTPKPILDEATLRAAEAACRKVGLS